MNIKAVIFLTVVGICSLVNLVEAQQPKKIPKIGWLAGSSLSAQLSRIEALRQGLRELGYVEGKNIVIEYRYADEKLDLLPALVSELLRLKVDIIVTTGSPPTRHAREATATIPIVMAQDPDPVGNGFVASLAHPGGNITGLATLAPKISGKQVEILKEIIPQLSRLAVLGTSTRPGTTQSFKELELAAQVFGVKLQYLDVLSSQDVEAAFQSAIKGRAEAVIVLGGPVFISLRTRVIELAAKSRLPAIYSTSDFGEAGGLASYGVSIIDLHRRSATYVDKILKGAKPAELPVEQPTIFELIINQKTARALGVLIPQSILMRADKIIE